MQKSLLVALGLLLLALAAPAQAIDFQVGQAWSYRARPGEQDSQLYIVQIDRDLGTRPIFHIYVDGLKLKNPLIKGGIQAQLAHLPVSQESLEASVVTMVQANASLPDITEGYVIWREAFLDGRAGVFTMPLNEAIQYIENAFNKPK
jgi:hypothetical protein